MVIINENGNGMMVWCGDAFLKALHDFGEVIPYAPIDYLIVANVDVDYKPDKEFYLNTLTDHERILDDPDIKRT